MTDNKIEFVAHRRRKKGVRHDLEIASFPSLVNDEPFRGVFTGISVEVSEPLAMYQIYENGNYGKGSKSRGAPQVITRKSTPETIDKEETLVLDLEEAFMLAHYLEILKIFTVDGVEMSCTEYFDAATNIQPLFLETFAAYMYFKTDKWVIKNGIKYGCHFLLYEKGIRFFHSSYAVLVTTPMDEWFREPINMRGIQRIAENSKKDILFLEVSRPDDFKIKSTSYIKDLIFDELIVRRFKFNTSSSQ